MPGRAVCRGYGQCAGGVVLRNHVAGRLYRHRKHGHDGKPLSPMDQPSSLKPQGPIGNRAYLSWHVLPPEGLQVKPSAQQYL